MTVSIILMGGVPPGDRELLAKVAQSLNGEVRLWHVPSLPSIRITGDEPHACMSYLPCDKNALIKMFASMPIGLFQELPFFQRIDEDAPPVFLKDLPIHGVFRSPLSFLSAWNTVTSIIRHATISQNNRELINEIIKYRTQTNQLINIGTALSSQNNINKLLSLILAESRAYVCADAGSIYIREKNGPGGAFINALRFKISQNDSVDVSQATEFVISMDQETIAGYVGFTGEPLNLEDVYHLPDSVPYKFGIDWDRKLGYRMKSMLTVPLKNLAGEVVGVLQLMNKKKDKSVRLSSPSLVGEMVTSFSLSDEEFVRSIGSQAAVSIERVQLYSEIETIFEGFLKSSIAAIDERDRITSGHSRRVMGYAMAFADAVNAAHEGPFRDISFSEARKNQFRFAALLHDIGKIGVPEALLMKETRLSKEEMASLYARIAYISLALATGPFRGQLPWKSEKELDDDWKFLETINRSGFLSDEDFMRLSALRGKYYFDVKGTRIPFLSDQEWESLCVRKGNLTEEERGRINSHALSTRRILSRIPWTKELERIPEIASHHHEKMDGSGYPDGLSGESISFESRALAVIDIFEALVSQDRPYKPKMTPDKAIGILRNEARANHLDPEIVEFFISKGIYKIFSTEKPLDEYPASN